MHKMHLQGRTVLELNMTWLSQDRPRLFTQMIHHPTECLQMGSAVAHDMYREVMQNVFGFSVPEDLIITVAPRSLPSTITLKELSPQHVESLQSIKGMVIRVSKIIPEIRVACFQCWHCQYIEHSVSGDRGRVFEPTRCQHCGKQYSFRLQHHLSIYEDKQLVKLQESPEHVSDGETPISISLVVYGNMVDAVVPGDRIVVTGIYRAVPLRLNSNTRIIKSVFSTHMDAVHIDQASSTRGRGKEKSSKSDLESYREGTAVNERLDLFHQIAKRSDIYDILLHSLARTIWGHEDVKRGILGQLFGGTPKTFVFSNSSDETQAAENRQTPGQLVSSTSGNRNSAFFRAELNIILCGDPGVAKSQLLTQVHEIAPRGIYTSGKGSSSVGLTAFVVQDSDTGELVLEPGALVLSDQGLCCIDEFDKMNDATRSVLHEVMEQQTLSIAKAGIIAQLNARTSILAAANPKESQWNVNLNVVENLQIEPTLLSRFDLIFLLLDQHNPEEDRRLASHVLSLYMDHRTKPDDAAEENGSEVNTNASTAGSPTGEDLSRFPQESHVDEISGRPIRVLMELDGEVFLQQDQSGVVYMTPAILSEYIAVARATIFPQLSEAAHRQLANCYVELRRGRGSNRTVSATLRQLESMIRLSESHAKMRFDTTVSEDDVKEAKRLISSALKEAATDPRTGLINLDMFHAPDPTKNTMEGNIQRLQEVIESKYISQGQFSAGVNDLRMALNERLIGGLRALSPTQFLELLALMSGGDVVKSFTGTVVTFVSTTVSKHKIHTHTHRWL
ncbi:minichromosome maintenance protein 4 (cell division control protein 54) [Angomonas deanei]|nr:minichromosome maintenance protein 4 (cell division control protein 54) [Angomonas deanei]|eukprot:EPY32245.1 minichromosome maintenance protein 4 (cell division control protein 54) [Angomonas deanei]